MNNEPDQLDHLLQQWVDRHEPSDAHLARLRQQILAQASGTPLISSSANWQRSVGLRAAIAALAACVLLAVAWLQPRPLEKVALEVPTGAVHVPAEHLQAIVAEMERLFEGRLAWIGETNQDIALGIPGDDREIPEGSHVAVRVVVLKRPSPSAPWQALWIGDVVSHSDELVEVVAPRDGSRLSLWAHLLPDGAVTIDTELAVGNDDKRWTSSTVQQPAVPTQIALRRDGTAEYQVWQTAAILPEGAL
jgi:hypothetical protein